MWDDDAIVGENRQKSEERKKTCTEEVCKGIKGTEKGTEFRINKREEKGEKHEQDLQSITGEIV